jgi:hypothetical protein
MRKWVELNVTFELVLPAPVPNVNREDVRYQRLVTLSVQLASKDARFADWARKFGLKTGQMKNDVERFIAMSEIDALVAHLYGLNRSQVEHVFKTFHRGWDCSPRLEKVLSFYDKLPKVAS